MCASRVSPLPARAHSGILLADFDADFVVTHRASPGGLVSFLVEINDLLAPLNFEVRRGGFEVVEGVPARRRGGGRDGDALEDAQHEATVWALVNRSQEGVMSLASDLSGVEVAYFKAMVGGALHREVRSLRLRK